MNMIDMLRDSEELELISAERIDADGAEVNLNVMNYIDLSPISRGSIITAAFKFNGVAVDVKD